MDIRRIEEFTGLKTEPQGRGFLLTFNTAQGPLGIEVLGDKLPVMFQALFAAAHRYGEVEPQKPELPKIEISSAVPIPSEEFATQSTPAGGLWLLFRAGSVDLSVALPDPRSSRSLAHALLNPS